MKKIIFSLMVILCSLHHSWADDLLNLKSKKVADFFIVTAQDLIIEIGKNTDVINYDIGNISLVQLAETLNESTVEVQYYGLVDNTGSVVDAIGTPHKVILDGNTWLEFIKSKKDIRLLVLHELLRMAQINDNDFRFSVKYIPILRSDKNISPYCNLRIQTTQVEYKRKKFTGEGFGTPPKPGQFSFNSNSSSAHEAQIDAIKDIKEKCEKKGYTEGPTNISGNIIMESKNTNGFISNILKVEMSGVCYKKNVIKRPHKDQRQEICHKINICKNISDKSDITESDEITLMNQLAQQWDCQ